MNADVLGPLEGNRGMPPYDFFNILIQRCHFTGNFNLCVDIADHQDTIPFSEILDNFNLKQQVTGPTHNSGQILALLLPPRTANIKRILPHLT